jgi:5-methylcytosine-specific restriction endonuclease McrA
MKLDAVTANCIVARYIDCQRSMKSLTQEFGLNHWAVKRLLMERRVAIRNKVEQRRSDRVFGRFNQSEAVKAARERGCYDTEVYRRTHDGRRWRGADHSGPNNGFFGRRHAAVTRERLSISAKERGIAGSGRYGDEWTAELRERVIERDGRRCRLCGKPGPVLQVHHIDGDRRNSAESNLLTLCAACHLGYHGRSECVAEILALGAETARQTGSAPPTTRQIEKAARRK